MKIAVLTYPLNNNFGNLLQAWALKTFFGSNGHAASICYRKSRVSYPAYYLNLVKVKMRRMLGLPAFQGLSPAAEKRFSSHTLDFISRKIDGTAFYSTKELYRFLNGHEAVVVGSDQVWRPKFLGKFYSDYFLYGFQAKERQIVISYAASLGTDAQEITPRAKCC